MTTPASGKDELRNKVIETIKGYEPIARSDSQGGEVPLGYDLIKDERTKYGFYWEYEDMEACADKIMQLIAQQNQQAVQKALAEKRKKLELRFVEFDPDMVKLISENLHDLF